MIYKMFQGEKLSLLGFGAMRLPQNADGMIDEAQVFSMVDYAMRHGVNYFDTAWPYHGGMSEVVLGKALARYPRQSWHLADKYPGHQYADRYDPAEIFEQQLKKCGVDYFDYYLLHNVYENDIGVYTDPQWGIIDYFVQQREAGRIRHLGFSTHARPDTLEKFLDRCGEQMEFCQIQLNYLDWTLQDAKAKYELLSGCGIPIWVMEPLRGGRLAAPGEAAEAQMKALRPDESAAAWALRWLMELDGVNMILSGMSSLPQMQDNVKTFTEGEPLSDTEFRLLFEQAEMLKDALPCTKCRYCCDGCPLGLDIPMLLHAWNDVHFEPKSFTVPMQLDALPQEKLPTACIGCGQCAAMCPQGIDIPAAMAAFADALPSLPNWAEICRQRSAAAAKLKEG